MSAFVILPLRRDCTALGAQSVTLPEGLLLLHISVCQKWCKFVEWCSQRHSGIWCRARRFATIPERLCIISESVINRRCVAIAAEERCTPTHTHQILSGNKLEPENGTNAVNASPSRSANTEFECPCNRGWNLWPYSHSARVGLLYSGRLVASVRWTRCRYDPDAVTKRPSWRGNLSRISTYFCFTPWPRISMMVCPCWRTQ